MSKYIGNKETGLEKVLSIVIVLLLGLLFVVATQPAWRGDEMIAEVKSDCDKRGGVLLEHKKMLSATYECVSRLD